LLTGPDVGDRRIRLGSVRLEGDGAELTGVKWAAYQPKADPFVARQNPEGKPIDFGPVVTAAGCRLTAESTALMVTPLPSEHGPEFSVRIRWAALGWKLAPPAVVEALDEDGNVLRRDPVRREAGDVVVDCAPGTFSYRIRAD
jgi:hypothetical protein